MNGVLYLSLVKRALKSFNEPSQRHRKAQQPSALFAHDNIQTFKRSKHQV